MSILKKSLKRLTVIGKKIEYVTLISVDLTKTTNNELRFVAAILIFYYFFLKKNFYYFC